MDVNLPGIDGIEATRDPRRGRTARSSCCSRRTTRTSSTSTGCGAAAYVAKAAFGPDRLSEAWAAAGDDLAAGPPVDRER